MNLRNILKIYNLERQLTTDDIALLNTLRGMNENERELLVESLGPQGRAVKKASKKSASSLKKSSRAQSLAGAIQKTPKARVDDDSGNDNECQFLLDGNSGEKCGTIENDPIHDLTYSSSHEFQPGKSHALAAGEGS